MNELDVIEEFEKKVNLKRESELKKLEQKSFNKYVYNIRNGYWCDYVFEYENKLREEREKKNMKVEDLSNMTERKVEIRLSRDYNVASVEVSGIDSVLEFEQEKEWALQEARDIWNQLPDSSKKQSNYTSKQTYQKNTQSQERISKGSGTVTIDDITITDGSPKQRDFLVQGINKGFFTLDEINSIPDYKGVSDYVSKFFQLNSKK